MIKGLKDLKELKARINTAIIQLGNELSTWVDCSSNMSDEFKTTIKNDYKRRLTALSNAINELGKKELKVLKIIKENKIEGLTLEWDGTWWTICAPDCPFPIAYGRKKEEYDLLKEVLS